MEERNITAVVHGQLLRVFQPPVVSDTIDYLEIMFQFSPEWDGMVKWAHFSKKEKRYDIRLTMDQIRKTSHLNLQSGVWRIWLHGERIVGGKVVERITSSSATLSVMASGELRKDGPLPKLPASAAEQIDAVAQQALEEAQRTAPLAAAAADAAEAAVLAASEADGHRNRAEQAAEAAGVLERQAQSDRAGAQSAAQEASASADRAGVNAETAAQAANLAEQSASCAARASTEAAQHTAHAKTAQAAAEKAAARLADHDTSPTAHQAQFDAKMDSRSAEERFSNALIRQAGGACLASDLVSPYAHAVQCRLESRNLAFDSVKTTAGPGHWKFYRDSPHGLQVKKGEQITMLASHAVPAFEIHYRAGGGKDQTAYSGDKKVFTFDADGEVQFVFYSSKEPFPKDFWAMLLRGDYTGRTYLPPVTDFTGITVKQYGGNLVRQVNARVLGGTLTQRDEQVFIASGNPGSEPGSANASSGRMAVGEESKIHLNAGMQVHVQYNYTILSNPHGAPYQAVNTYLVSDGGAVVIQRCAEINQPKIRYRVAQTLTVSKTGNYYAQVSLNSKQVKIENFTMSILQEVPADTYIEPQTFQALPDGTVPGIHSLSPHMTLLADTDSVLLHAQWKLDANGVVERLARRITDLENRAEPLI